MPRFFIDPSLLSESSILLTGENAAHAKVLRLQRGEEVSVCDGQGTDYRCQVTNISPNQYMLEVLSKSPAVSEATVKACIYMAFAKADKMEHVVQKATELGAYEIVAFPSTRCVSRPDAKSLAKKLERWQKIATSAAEQSRRGRIPQVIAVNSYQEAVQRASTCQLAVNFYENESQTTLSSVLPQTALESIALMTGPEGGYEPEEILFSQKCGMKICTLGRRILRCETAPLCALSAVMFHCGEF